MRIACLQFTPIPRDPVANSRRATEVLEKAGIGRGSVDVVVGPEMAFSGYVFTSPTDINPFVEDPEDGVAGRWAKDTAARLDACVQIGFPHRDSAGALRNSVVVAVPSPSPSTSATTTSTPTTPSASAPTPAAHIATVYNKHHLFETDENWAVPGEAFWSGEVEGLDVKVGSGKKTESGKEKVGLGICMDVNPWRFKAPFTAYEFARFHVQHGTTLLLLSMAWLLSRDPSDPSALDEKAKKKHVRDTLEYWAARLMPMVEATATGGREVVVVVANRTGQEGDVTFCGCSCVFVFRGGRAYVVGHMSLDDEGVLVVET
ncbi:carbon-nitrogen hydrolase [Gonapodya prolifera JEL478]|uniref:Carbon-nitrogen hydrolase n=1 Tax=Gonapodya prolifera (strain JEL478) TaxID=1344416 RepID=A0A139A9H1_GONPJ|nr:carbon-nitrogen hydrolase [Gonapodya prolifera JEL478]|eukprot:KXS13450.1 carbon-nitrogen hydrolase [Gonapodya prolifera JEL478]